MTQPAGRRLGVRLTGALGYLSMAGSLSTDLYLPAFPDISADLGAPASVVQLTLTAFLIGSALGQLVIGSISDVFGRRRTLIVALAVFTVCCFLAVASPVIGMLIFVRGVQGFAGAAGSVLARAVVADLSAPGEAVRAFSRLWIMTALGPAVASPLGALLTQVGGWRTALLGLAVLATGMLLTAAFAIPESLPHERRHPATPRAIGHAMARLLRDRRFAGWAIAFATAYAGLMAYIGSSSFIVQDVLGITAIGYGFTFTATSVAVMLGAWLSGRLAACWTPAGALRSGQLLALGAALLTWALALTQSLTLATYLPLVVAFCIGCGTMMSTASALDIGAAGRSAGTGSALIGFTQFVLGAIASPLGGIAGTGTAVPAAIVMTICPVIGVVAASAAARVRARDRRPS
ncbi:multidrug effflux MFS transporter [Microbacterium kribbense]|uniref:Multidrug effflux MFS transporter n=1 Tax=Microbacterium kribbense TaxID=433645 RepID=A0ABP7G865_9MICO